ncbi:hypothetical protein ACGF0D_43100 [Kitasatospora sp. NPDC048298]
MVPNSEQHQADIDTTADDWPFTEDPCSATPSCPCDWHDRPVAG